MVRQLFKALAIICLFVVAGANGAPGQSTGELEDAALAKRVKDISFDRLPLKDVIASLSLKSGKAIDPDWEMLKRYGTLPDEPVTLHLQNTSLAAAMELVLRQCVVTTTYELNLTDAGRLRITPIEEMMLHPLIRDYPLQFILPADARDDKVSALIEIATRAAVEPAWTTYQRGFGKIERVPGALRATETAAGQRRLRAIFEKLRHPVDPLAPPPQDLAHEMDESLHQKLENLQLAGAPLRGAVEKISRDTGVDIAVDWRSLERVGIDTGAPVTIDARAIRVASVLDALCKSIGGNDPLMYSADDGFVRLSVTSKLSLRQIAIVYDVQKLLAGRNSGDKSNSSATKSENDLLATIDVALQPSAAAGSRTFLNRRLVVVDTPDNQRQIFAVLQTLAKSKKPN